MQDVPFDDEFKEEYKKLCDTYGVTKEIIEERRAREIEKSAHIEESKYFKTIQENIISSEGVINLENLPIKSWGQIRKIVRLIQIESKDVEVWKCQITVEGKDLIVAVKSNYMIERKVSVAKQAVYMACMQNHENFLKLYGSFWDKDNNKHRYNLVMEFGNESLNQLVHRWDEDNKEPIESRENQALNALKSLTTAMHYLNQKGICHRDIKPDNILISEDGKYKISDFDISEDSIKNQFGVTETVKGAKITGTVCYASPELRVFLSGPKKDERSEASLNYNKSDVFSLGLTILRMVTPVNEGALNVMSTGLEGIINDAINTVKRPELADLLRIMLAIDPKRRPSFAELLNIINLGMVTEA